MSLERIPINPNIPISDILYIQKFFTKKQFKSFTKVMFNR